MAEFFIGIGATRNIGRGRGRGRGSSNVGGRSTFVQFITPAKFIGALTISGQTLDSTSTPLANCVVELELSSNGQQIALTTSDGSGNYSFGSIASGTNYQVTAYKAGSPDVAGITINTLVGQ